MRVHLVNPSDLSFGTAVITPRWLYVLAAATPDRFGTPLIVDETLEPFDADEVRRRRRRRHRHSHGQRAARVCRRPPGARRAAPSSCSAASTPRSSRTKCASTGAAQRGQRRRRSRLAAGAGRLRSRDAGARRTTAVASRARRSRPRAGISCRRDRYMWGSVQTVRGCPKHCSFCSVWRTDGQKPRQRHVAEVVREVVALRRKGFRFILLADDNFYPVTLADLAAAERRADKTRSSRPRRRCARSDSS